MEVPKKHRAEAERLAALRELELLDTPPEEALDACVKLAAEICDVKTAALTLIDAERQWFKAVFGRLPNETPRDVSFCGHVVEHDDVLVVPDATQDPRFADNPLVTSGVVRFYAGLPLEGRDGLPLGTLCVIDDEPSELTEEQLAALEVVRSHLEEYLALRLLCLRFGVLSKDDSEQAAQLGDADRRRRDSTAMLVHDLRNPLTVVGILAQSVMESGALPPHLAPHLDEIRDAVASAQSLVANALDVARSESGEVPAQFARCDVSQIVRQVLVRVRPMVIKRERAIEVVDELADPEITADSFLVSRAIRNFLDNALKYAPQGSTISVVVRGDAAAIEIRVVDRGTPIPVEQRTRIFEAYHTDGDQRSSYGLGLALCAVVAKLHGGKTWVEDAPGGGNAFVLQLPRTARRPPRSA